MYVSAQPAIYREPLTLGDADLGLLGLSAAELAELQRQAELMGLGFSIGGLFKTITTPFRVAAKGVEEVGKGVVKGAEFAAKNVGTVAPFAALIPGIGLPLAAAIGAGGKLVSGVARGQNIGQIAKSTVTGAAEAGGLHFAPTILKAVGGEVLKVAPKIGSGVASVVTAPVKAVESLVHPSTNVSQAAANIEQQGAQLAQQAREQLAQATGTAAPAPSVAPAAQPSQPSALSKAADQLKSLFTDFALTQAGRLVNQPPTLAPSGEAPAAPNITISSTAPGAAAPGAPAAGAGMPGWLLPALAIGGVVVVTCGGL